MGPKTRYDYHLPARLSNFWPLSNLAKNTVKMQSPGPLGPSTSSLLVPKNSSESTRFSFSCILGSSGLFWTPLKTRARASLGPFFLILGEIRVPRTRVLTPRKHYFEREHVVFHENPASSLIWPINSNKNYHFDK